MNWKHSNIREIRKRKHIMMHDGRYSCDEWEWIKNLISQPHFHSSPDCYIQIWITAMIIMIKIIYCQEYKCMRNVILMCGKSWKIGEHTRKKKLLCAFICLYTLALEYIFLIYFFVRVYVCILCLNCVIFAYRPASPNHIRENRCTRSA